MSILTMRKIKLKYFIAVPLILIAVLFVPLKWPVNFNSLGNNEVVVHAQECGCDCPDVEIIKGQFTIPDSLSTKLKNPIYEADLDNDPYCNIELWGCQLKIKGEIIGAIPDYCDAQSCYYHPIIKVQSWQLTNYVSWFWAWNVKFAITYLAITLISILITITWLVVKLVEHFKNKPTQFF